MELEDTQVQPDTVDQDVDTGVDNETNDSSNDSDDFKEKYENQKKRAEKAEAQLKKFKSSLSDDGDEDDSEPEPVTNPESERIDRLELRADGYAPEVIDEIMKLGGKEALSNPILKKSADELQAEYSARKAADIQDGPQGTSKTKYSAEDLANMSSEEMEKILPHAE